VYKRQLVPHAPAPRTMPRTAFPRAMPPASPAPFAVAASGGRVRGLLAPAPPRAVRSVCRGGAAAVGAAAVGRVRRLDPGLGLLGSGHPNPWSNLVSFSRGGAAAVDKERQLKGGLGLSGCGRQNPWSNLVSFYLPHPSPFPLTFRPQSPSHEPVGERGRRSRIDGRFVSQVCRGGHLTPRATEASRKYCMRAPRVPLWARIRFDGSS